jgi:hypothetical protein
MEGAFYDRLLGLPSIQNSFDGLEYVGYSNLYTFCDKEVLDKLIYGGLISSIVIDDSRVEETGEEYFVCTDDLLNYQHDLYITDDISSLRTHLREWIQCGEGIELDKEDYIDLRYIQEYVDSDKLLDLVIKGKINTIVEDPETNERLEYGHLKVSDILINIYELIEETKS